MTEENAHSADGCVHDFVKNMNRILDDREKARIDYHTKAIDMDIADLMDVVAAKLANGKADIDLQDNLIHSPFRIRGNTWVMDIGMGDIPNEAFHFFNWMDPMESAVWAILKSTALLLRGPKARVEELEQFFDRIEPPMHERMVFSIQGELWSMHVRASGLLKVFEEIKRKKLGSESASYHVHSVPDNFYI